jgi:hypothetical protein
MPTILKGCSEEVRQLFLLMAEAAHRDAAPAGAETPAEPGPVIPG